MRTWITAATLAAATALVPLGAATDLAKVGGPESCAECHLEEVEAWKLTKHFSTMSQMHRRPEAEAMLAKLDLKNMKLEARCTECHYTNKLIDGQPQATSGISCESCHGAGADWAKTHGDYGEGFTRETEPAAHRIARRSTAIAKGMLNPDNLYGVGANCYSCHILTDEALANTGGHSLGSPGFELLAWSQGEVRHTILSHNKLANPEATLPRRRELFVVGCILETEYSLRAVARATAKATYGITNARRADAARKRLAEIQALAPTPELAAIIAVVQPLQLRLNQSAALNAAADQVAALGHDFAARISGDRLAGIDALLPAATAYKGKPYEVIAKPQAR